MQQTSLTDKKPTVQSIYEMLRAMITEFKIAPGARLTESQLADYFDVSRTPVRAALQRLENEGQVEIRAKQGCFVRTIDLETISQYYDVRLQLERMSVIQAHQSLPNPELELLAEQWDPEKQIFGSDVSDDLKIAEESFHIELAQASGNHVLAGYLQDINDHIRVVRRFGWPDKKSVDDTYLEHYRICQYIFNDQLEDALAEMENHIRKSQDQANRISLHQIYSKKQNPFE